jgi:hypothetical protein
MITRDVVEKFCRTDPEMMEFFIEISPERLSRVLDALAKIGVIEIKSADVLARRSA